jgi:Asp-tRNA(Asn)/Glu-tRNA(Gln) amidotransferase A subunit family amidase
MVTPAGRPSARAWLARLDAGECSARELTEQTLAAIADDRVHAVVDLNAEAALAGIGTDGGGSIRVPAHYTGIAAFVAKTRR